MARSIQKQSTIKEILKNDESPYIAGVSLIQIIYQSITTNGTNLRGTQDPSSRRQTVTPRQNRLRLLQLHAQSQRRTWLIFLPHGTILL